MNDSNSLLNRRPSLAAGLAACLFATLFFILPPAAPAQSGDSGSSSSPLSSALESRLAERAADAPALEDAPGSLRERVQDAAGRFYGENGHHPVWLEDGRPGSRAEALLAAVEGVEADGLSPTVYGPDELRRLLESASGGSEAAARAELALSQTFLVLAEHLGSGRLDPDRAETSWYIDDPSPDFAAALSEVAEGGGVAEVLEGTRPPHDGYDRLQQGLERYRKLAADGGWPRVPEGAVLNPGDEAPRERIEALVSRLQPEGFLSEGYAPSPVEGAAEEAADRLVYDRELSDAVGRFQERYGIVVDGLVGPGTLAAMNLSAEERVRRIALNLERWRWLPDDLGRRYVMVDVPGFAVRGYEEDEPGISMKVVVGKEGAQTPSFSDTMTHAIVNPYWNVPHSITVSEILPQARQNPGHLAANDYEIVTGWGNDAGVVEPSGTAFANLESGAWRIRQRPGAGNALGRIKFMFPNEHNIYLHDTPADHLFGEDVRALSHGCVRLERPYDFGDWVFQPSSEWDRSRLKSAVDAGERRRLELPEELPVYLVYWTAWVDEAGTVHFRKDLYGHDEALADELGAGAS